MIQPKFDINETVFVVGTIKRIVVQEDNTINYVVELNGADFKSRLALTSNEIVEVPKNPVRYMGDTCDAELRR